jgi:hypothetical protein
VRIKTSPCSLSVASTEGEMRAEIRLHDGKKYFGLDELKPGAIKRLRSEGLDIKKIFKSLSDEDIHEAINLLLSLLGPIGDRLQKSLGGLGTKEFRFSPRS